MRGGHHLSSGAKLFGFSEATHTVWWILVGAGVLVFSLGLLSTGARGRASAERVAHLLEEPQ